MVCLGKPERKEKDLLQLLNILMSRELQPSEKKQKLEDDFSIPMTTKMMEGMNNMVSMWDVAVQEGINQGISQGKIDAATSIAQKYNLSIDDVIATIGVNKDDYALYAPAIKRELAR